MQQELLSNANATTSHLQEQEIRRIRLRRHAGRRIRAGAAHSRPRAQAAAENPVHPEKIDAGDYGYCEDTGEPIGLKRLLARSTASLSVEAQERRERMKSSTQTDTAVFAAVLRPPYPPGSARVAVALLRLGVILI